MKENLLKFVEISTLPSPDASVIWLHGLGADGNDFAPAIPQLQLPASLAVRFIFPHAPTIPITCNEGYVMRGWYDIYHLDHRILLEVDMKGISRSVRAIERLIAHENERGIPSNRIVLAGFSQGGVVAYVSGLTHTEKLAGIVALSTYLPPLEVIKPLSRANQVTSIFAAHGSEDTIVPIDLGYKGYQQLEENGYPVTWQVYPMSHSVCLAEMKDMGQFLNKAFS